jgi:hypothetical protein
VSKSLWLKLVVPLALLFALSLLVHQWWPAAGFFVSLATTLFGIIVTVAYVDWVLSAHEKARWAGTGSRVQERLYVNATLVVTFIRQTLGFGVDIPGP